MKPNGPGDLIWKRRSRSCTASSDGVALSTTSITTTTSAASPPILLGEGTATAAIGITGPASVVTNARVPDVTSSVHEATARLARRLYGEPPEEGAQS